MTVAAESSGSDPSDPQAGAVYRAEDAALAGVGPRLARWADVEAFVEAVVTSPDWVEHPAVPPIEVVVERRSSSARYAAASHEHATVWIPAGHWTAPVVLHELAHLLCPSTEDHGPAWCGAFLWLVRRVLGIEAYGALRTAFDRAGVRYVADWPGRPQQRSASPRS
jgi:putative metallohydrolase (TIGR04338 family)